MNLSWKEPFNSIGIHSILAHPASTEKQGRQAPGQNVAPSTGSRALKIKTEVRSLLIGTPLSRSTNLDDNV